MKPKRMLAAMVALVALLFTACDDKAETETPPPPDTNPPFIFPDSPALGANELAGATQITIDHSQTYQTIEGFGFFGARDKWWGGADDLYSDAWAERVIGDLGMTMWRNELYSHLPVNATDGRTDHDKNYPSFTGDLWWVNGNQDANWAKQKPVVEKLYKKAKDLGVDLKIILTVWSPPGQWKNGQSAKGAEWSGAEAADKNRLLPNNYTNYGNWLVAGLDLYKAISVPVYAISLQNEPGFNEPYSSCIYSAAEYANMLKTVAPIVKAKYPDVLIFGAEGMLDMETASWAPGAAMDFHAKIKANSEALRRLDRFAVHGYQAEGEGAGVASLAVSQHKQKWEDHNKLIASTGKEVWMTETSGFPTGNWSERLQIGTAIGTALKYGHVSAWVWWQGTEGNGGDFSATGKHFPISKQFYRYIRPGAVMVSANCTDSTLLSIAFMHGKEKRFTVVILNSGNANKKVALTGSKVPESFTRYQTTATDNCKNMGESTRIVTVPAMSITTLVTEY
jgi:O-glycosyl hydrolase